MRTSARLVYDGLWSRSVSDGGPMQPLAVDDVAVLQCCTAPARLVGWCGLKPRIKSLTGGSSPRFVEGRCAGQSIGVYACGQA
jgi:hypothetical protein